MKIGPNAFFPAYSTAGLHVHVLCQSSNGEQKAQVADTNLKTEASFSPHILAVCIEVIEFHAIIPTSVRASWRLITVKTPHT